MCVCSFFKVCSQNECVELETAYRNTNCSAKCSGHAVSPRPCSYRCPERASWLQHDPPRVSAQVCNHKNVCQCEHGWMPPDCTTTDGRSSLLTSKSRRAEAVLVVLPPPPPHPGGADVRCPSAEVIVAVVVVLVLLGVIAAVLALLWKRRKLPM